MGRVVVVGGGIAGVATAAALAARGREVVLFEREPHLGTQSSALNAAIFRLAVAEPVNVRLALRSRDIGSRVCPGGTVRALGGLYPCADDREREAILDAAAFAGVRAARLDDVPAPMVHRDRPAVFSPDDGVIDTAALVEGLAREARAAGATIRVATPVDGLERASGRVSGVVVNGESIPAVVVVDATGAWSPQLAADSDVGIRPHRRHLFVLDTPLASAFPSVIWDLTDWLYLRPESGGLLVSPCDETAMPASDGVPRDVEVRAVLFDKLSRWAPALADATVRRWWAGLRPLTPDHRFVVGPDPLLPGLFRVGGFGGHGMTAGAAAGELAAAILCGEDPPDARELSPDRFQLVRLHPSEARTLELC